MRRYVDVRLEFRKHFNDPAKLAEGLRASAELENAIWAHAEAAARESPTPTVVSFISAVNDMIDTDADRVAAGRNHIPGAVWLLVVLVAAFGCFTSAYGSGAQGARSNFTSFFLPLLLTIVIGLIFDVDHALQGMVRDKSATDVGTPGEYFQMSASTCKFTATRICGIQNTDSLGQPSAFTVVRHVVNQSLGGRLCSLRKGYRVT